MYRLKKGHTSSQTPAKIVYHFQILALTQHLIILVYRILWHSYTGKHHIR